MERSQRIVIAMLDGLGMDYYLSGGMPGLRAMAEEGFFARVGGMFPSVTNDLLSRLYENEAVPEPRTVFPP